MKLKISLDKIMKTRAKLLLHAKERSLIRPLLKSEFSGYRKRRISNLKVGVLPFSSIKKDLVKLNRFEVIIFGSYVNGKFTSRSDIDIAVITRNNNPEKNKKIWASLLKIPSLYHLNIFELLPLNVKADIMDNHLVLFGERLAIRAYF